MSVVLTHRVRYHEADAQGFLFNARYLELADVAMTEYFRRLGWPYPVLVASGCDPSVVRATVEYRRPARFEDLLDVDVRAARVGRASFALDMAVRRGTETLADLGLVYVNVDAPSATSRPLPADVAAALRDDLAVAPD